MAMFKITSQEAAFISVMAALIYVATSIAIPMPRPLGIWHFGDIMTFITGILFVAMVLAVTVKNFGYFFYDYYLYGPVAYLDLITFFPADALYILVTIPLLKTLRRLINRDYIIP